MDPFSAHILADARRQDYLREAEQSRLARAVREPPTRVNPEASHEHDQGRESDARREHEQPRQKQSEPNLTVDPQHCWARPTERSARAESPCDGAC